MNGDVISRAIHYLVYISAWVAHARIGGHDIAIIFVNIIIIKVKLYPEESTTKRSEYMLFVLRSRELVILSYSNTFNYLNSKLLNSP